MNKQITINYEDIVRYLKLSCQFPQILKGAIRCKIIQEQISIRNISVKPDELQQVADNFRASRKLSTIEDTYNWLKKHYLSLDEFDSLIYTNTFVQRLIAELFGNQVNSFFEEHRLDYTRCEIQEIILNDEILANQLFRTLKQGQVSFAQVAEQYKTHPALQQSKSNQLCYNADRNSKFIYHSDLLPEIAAAVLMATPPQLLPPIITSQGVHLIQVINVVQPKLDDPLREQILSELFSGWLQQQIEEVDVLMDFELNSEVHDNLAIKY